MNGQKGLRYCKSLRTNSSLEERLNIAPSSAAYYAQAPCSSSSGSQLPGPSAEYFSGAMFVVAGPASIACWRARNWPIITSRTPPVRICVAGWDGFRRPVIRMRRRSPWHGVGTGAPFSREAARGIEIKIVRLCCRFFLCATTALGASQIRDFY
jgi:hypothetical protein